MASPADRINDDISDITNFEQLEEILAHCKSAMECFPVCEECGNHVENGNLICEDCKDNAIAEAYK